MKLGGAILLLATYVSKTDISWIQFYPILRDGNPTNSIQ